MENNDIFGYDDTKNLLEKSKNQKVKDGSEFNNSFNATNIQSSFKDDNSDIFSSRIVKDTEDYNHEKEMNKIKLRSEKKKLDEKYTELLRNCSDIVSLQEDYKRELRNLEISMGLKFSELDSRYNHLTYDEKNAGISQLSDGKKSVVTFEGDADVKIKSISRDDFYNKVKKTIVIGAIALGTFVSAATGLDMLNHPENYLTTDPNFEGRATVVEIIERTPENIEAIANYIVDNGGKTR